VSAEAEDVFNIKKSDKPASSGPPATEHSSPSNAMRAGGLSASTATVVVASEFDSLEHAVASTTKATRKNVVRAFSGVLLSLGTSYGLYLAGAAR
jgi:hypothetical protein